MANFAAQGTIGAPFPVSIERGKIIEFATATHSGNPAYQQQRPVVPPTFLTTQMFWQEWAGAGANPWHHVKLDQQRGMHAEQEYVFHGEPPRAGTTLTAQSRIAEIYQRQGRRGGTLTFAVLVTEFRDAAGRLVAEARMTGVETARPPTELSTEAPVEAVS
jgi:N-terminal half of MaoC dehydratase